MASITYEHLGDVTQMLAAQEQFRGITKMVAGTNTANQGKEDSHEV